MALRPLTRDATGQLRFPVGWYLLVGWAAYGRLARPEGWAADEWEQFCAATRTPEEG